jgi:uncharacterized protein (TIGR02996 family)
MRIEQGFLHDILENPEDDTPRLVYADWLEDQGRVERAELIRVQCELVRLDRYDPRWPGLRRREDQLLAHTWQWIEDIGLGELEEPQFRRGFLEHAAFANCLDYLAQARRLLQRVPMSSAAFGALVDVDDEREASDGLRKLLGSKYIRPLRRLEFHTTEDFPREGLALLSRLPSRACLEELDLSDNDLNDEDVEVLARCPTLARLRVLNLGYNDFGAEGVYHLAASPHVAGLRELILDGGEYRNHGVEGIVELVSSSYLTGLTALSLYNNHIGSEGLTQLARWPGLEGLVRLNLGYYFRHDAAERDPDPAGMRELVESPQWKVLRELDVSNGTLGDLATLEMFLAAANVATLRVLHLGGFGDQEDEAARLVARAPVLDGLIELHFDRHGLTLAGRHLLHERFGERLLIV